MPNNCVYLITGPTGRMYVGITNKTAAARWGEHVALSRRDMSNHPLRDAIRKYGPASFSVTVLADNLDRESAKETEVFYIKELKTLCADGGYNVGRGGNLDFEDLHQRSWKAIKRDAMSFSAYRKKLSEALRNCGRTDYSASVKAIREWQLAHPEEWREIHRKRIEAWKSWAAENPEKVAINAAHALEKARQKIRDEPEWFTERLTAGIRKSFQNPERVARHIEQVRKVWAQRDVTQRKEIGDKISKTKKEFHANRESEEEKALRSAQLASARSRINHDLRKARQKEALLAYWTPERRAEFSAKRKELALRKKKKAENDANV